MPSEFFFLNPLRAARQGRTRPGEDTALPAIVNSRVQEPVPPRPQETDSARSIASCVAVPPKVAGAQIGIAESVNRLSAAELNGARWSDLQLVAPTG